MPAGRRRVSLRSCCALRTGDDADVPLEVLDPHMVEEPGKVVVPDDQEQPEAGDTDGDEDSRNGREPDGESRDPQDLEERVHERERPEDRKEYPEDENHEEHSDEDDERYQDKD